MRSCLTVICALRGIAQRLRPGNEIESPVVKGHLARRLALLAPLGGDGQHGRAHGFRHRGDPARIGHGAVAALHLQDDVAVPDNDGGEIAII